MSELADQVVAMSDDQPTFSVVMPVFNSRRFLRGAIESVLGQTCPDFELLVFDDGSTDSSWEVAKEFAQKDRRLSIARCPRRGVVATRNAAISEAKGQFLAFLDSDDEAEPARLELQLKYLTGNPGCVAVGGQILYVDADGDPLYVSDLPRDHESIDRQLMAGFAGSITHGTTAVSREAVARIGGFRSHFPIAEDFDLYLRLAEVGRLANLDDVLIKYRQHEESLCATHHDVSVELTERAISDARRRRGLPEEASEIPLPRDRSGLNELMFRSMKAYSHGYQGTAMKYAKRALLSMPFNPRVWRMALVVVLGPHLRRFRAASHANRGKSDG